MKKHKKKHSKFRVLCMYSRLLALALVVHLLPCMGTLWAQTTCEGDYVLTSQDDVDSFAETGCNIISGNLRIEGPNITDLDGLSGLTSIGGDMLIFSNYALTNIDGLSNLTTIGGKLNIWHNLELTNIDGLSGLSLVGGDLEIENNNELENLDGLSSLTSVGYLMVINDNASLSNIDGLSSLTSVDRVMISDNDVLENLDGLSSLTSLSSTLRIARNSSLTSVDGLSALTTIGGFLTIQENALLTNIDGFSSLTSVAGDLIIENNDALITIDGLSNLTSIGGMVEILDNASLTNLDGLSSLTSAIIKLSIRNNPALTNIDGLSNLSAVGDWYVGIVNNDALVNLDGLSSLISIDGSLVIYDNDVLENIDGLSSLMEVGGNLDIIHNINLTRCCGIYPLLAFGTVGGSKDISENGNGCTEEDILVPGFCISVAIEDVIDDVEILINAGILNGGQGNALIVKLQGAIAKVIQGKTTAAINKLNAFINQVNAYTKSGILTETEGQELILAATYIIDLINNSSFAKRIGDYVSPKITGIQQEHYYLSQNYPNPFNPVTQITFTLPEDLDISLKVFDILGREVANLASGKWNAGIHRISLNAAELTSGIYIYKLNAGDFVDVKKMVLMK